MMTRPKEIRVLLADDHVMVREGLTQLLREHPSIEVAGQAGSGEEVLAQAETAKPDVVVLDYSMPKGDAPTVIGQLRKRFPRVRILVLTVHENIHYAVNVLEAGAQGYIIKSSAVQELVDAIRAVHGGEIFISAKLSQSVLKHLLTPKKERAGLEALSQREFDMLRVLGAGMSLTASAEYLDISPSAASTYRARLMEKLRLDSTAAIIRFALENGIVG
ncbi:MAG: response regulator transcription factor [Elusimicrobiota bacterium]